MRLVPALSIVASIVLVAFGSLHALDYKPLVPYAVSLFVQQSESMTHVDESATKILFCGTGSPSRSVHRAGPCIALLANGELFLFDAGEGAIGKLHEYGAPAIRLRAIFLTHLHSDHMSGVAEVIHNTWLFGRTKAVDVIGPPGTTKLMRGLRTAYEDDVSERMHVLHVDGVDPEMAFSPGTDVAVGDSDIVTVYEGKNLQIEAFQVNHPEWPYAYGYRIRTGERTIVISGDTTVSEGVRKFAAGADLLIHEAYNASFMALAGEAFAKSSLLISAARIQSIVEVHTSTLDLADLATSADVSSLVVTHLIPSIPDNFVARAAFTSGMADRFSGHIAVAHDGLWMDLDSDDSVDKPVKSN